jgi:hypothetical protein
MPFKSTFSLEGFAKVIPILSKRPKNQGRTHESNHATDEKMLLIRNFHVEQIICHLGTSLVILS